MNGYQYSNPYYYYQNQDPDFQAFDFVPQTPEQINSLNDAYTSYMALIQEHPGEKFVRYAKRAKAPEGHKAKFGKTRKASFNVFGVNDGSLPTAYKQIDNREKVLDLYLTFKDNVKANENLHKIKDIPVLSEKLDKIEIEELNPVARPKFRKTSHRY